LVFAYGHPSSGIPATWSAAADRAGVNLLDDLSAAAVGRVRQQVEAVRRAGDVVLVSIHWGGNWGYHVPPEQRAFAHQLVDEAGVDVVHGHSSHHVKGIEVYRGRLVLYGCGDLINDYEGIGGYEQYRSDLSLLYLARIDPETGTLVGLDMVPMQARRLQLRRASRAEARWLAEILNREGRAFGTRVELSEDGALSLRWD
jgi:poly-gamma-glutamate synthesis protein (capsule biosynthesis protein)